MGLEGLGEPPGAGDGQVAGVGPGAAGDVQEGVGLRESEPRLQEGLVKPTQGLLGDEAEEEVLADGAPDLGGVGLGDGRQGPEAFRGDVPQGEADGDGIEALLLLLEEVGAPPGVKAWGKGEGLFGRAGKPWGLGLWGRGPGLEVLAARRELDEAPLLPHRLPEGGDPPLLHQELEPGLGQDLAVSVAVKEADDGEHGGEEVLLGGEGLQKLGAHGGGP